MLRRPNRRPRHTTCWLLATFTSCLECTRITLIVTSSVESVVAATSRILPLLPLPLLLQPLLPSPPPLGTCPSRNLPSVSNLHVIISPTIIPTTPWRIISLLMLRVMLVMWLMLRARGSSSGGGSREWWSRSGMGAKGHS